MRFGLTFDADDTIADGLLSRNSRLQVAAVRVENGIVRRREQRMRTLGIEHAVPRGKPVDVRGIAHEHRIGTEPREFHTQTFQARCPHRLPA